MRGLLELGGLFEGGSYMRKYGRSLIIYDIFLKIRVRAVSQINFVPIS